MGTDHPSITQQRMREYADRWGLTADEDLLENHRELLDGLVDSVEGIVDAPVERVATSDADRTFDVDATDDPHNAWLSRCRVTRPSGGPLSEWTVGLKDNVALAGAPMTCGSRVLSDFEANVDAAVVRRVLDAGATVVGKQNMDAFALGATGDLSEFGPTQNPHDETRLAGGSSAGSAAAVAAGDCDLSIATDQGGSIRAPSAWCGCVGMKPTYGLVPYTGLFSADPSVDHAGPITRTVADNAASLGILTGADDVGDVLRDRRQSRNHPTYDQTIGHEVEDLRVGVVEEGFGRERSDDAVDEAVREALDELESAGVETDAVSVPALDHTAAMLDLVGTLGAARTTFGPGRPATTRNGRHWTELNAAIADADPETYPPNVTSLCFMAAHLADSDLGWLYGVMKNCAVEATRVIDALLDEYDALALPTTPMLPMAVEPDLDVFERIERNAGVMVNTALFDHTGHPALSVPCGTSQGLPVGLQLVGDRYDEQTLYRLGGAVEAAADVSRPSDQGAG